VAKSTLANNVRVTAGEVPVVANGSYSLFTSGKVNLVAGDNWLEVVVTYHQNLPDPEVQVSKYNLTAIIETEDDDGNWHPIHFQYRPFIKQETGNIHIIRLDPNAFQLDYGVPSTISNGNTNIAVESIKQGVLPDDFRVKVMVNEFGHDSNGATSASFDEATFSVTYTTLTV